MKKLLKSVICGSVNSAYIHCSCEKVNICGYCSMNSNRITPKQNAWKKKKKKRNTASETQRGTQTHRKYTFSHKSIHTNSCIIEKEINFTQLSHKTSNISPSKTLYIYAFAIVTIMHIYTVIVAVYTIILLIKDRIW